MESDALWWMLLKKENVLKCLWMNVFNFLFLPFVNNCCRLCCMLIACSYPTFIQWLYKQNKIKRCINLLIRLFISSFTWSMCGTFKLWYKYMYKEHLREVELLLQGVPHIHNVTLIEILTGPVRHQTLVGHRLQVREKDVLWSISPPDGENI